MKKILILKQIVTLSILILCSPLSSDAGISAEERAACSRCQSIKACDACRKANYDRGVIPCLSDCHVHRITEKTNLACRQKCTNMHTKLFNACVNKSVPQNFRQNCTFTFAEGDE